MSVDLQPRRILVVKLRHIGDVLLLTPVFESLREAFPNAELFACVNEKTGQVLATNPLLKGILSVPTRGWLQQAHFIRHLRRQKFDLVIDFTGSDRSAILARLSGAENRWGYHRVKGFLGRNRLFTRTVRRAREVHVVEQQAALLQAFGVASPALKLSFVVREEDRRTVSALVPEATRFVHVHPVSRVMVKTWPANHLSVLLNRLAARGFRVVLTASDDPNEKKYLSDLARRLQTPALDLSGKVSLPQLAALSERAALFVGVDSAPLHIAAAVGTPVIGIFGPSSETLWGPWCQRKLVLSRDLDCRLPCKLKNTCPHIACLREMTPEMVIPKVDEFLATLNL